MFVRAGSFGGWQGVLEMKGRFVCLLAAAEPPADADNDGMPDEWEKAHGLDPRSAGADRKMPSGYTAIEEYVNQLADKLVEAAARTGPGPAQRGSARPRSSSPGQPHQFKSGLSPYPLSGKSG